MEFGEVSHFAWCVRRAVLAGYANSERACIEHTRVAVEAGRYFGYAVEPVPVRVCAATADWRDWPDGDKDNAPGWSVGVAGTGAHDRPGNAWDGHLVGHLDGWLADFSAEQLHRPQRGLRIEAPVVIAVSRDLLRAGLSFQHRRTGVYHLYREIDDRSWRCSGAWTTPTAGHRRAIRTAVVAVIRAHRDRLRTGQASSDPPIAGDTCPWATRRVMWTS